MDAENVYHNLLQFFLSLSLMLNVILVQRLTSCLCPTGTVDKKQSRQLKVVGNCTQNVDNVHDVHDYNLGSGSPIQILTKLSVA